MTRLQVFLLGCLMMSILVPVAFTQRRGGPGGFGGPGSRSGRGGFSADSIFDRRANGANSFNVNTVELRQFGSETVEQQREKMMTFLQTKGVTNGMMTRELFKEFYEKQSADRTRGMAEKTFESLAKNGNSFDVDKVEISGYMLMAGPADKQREQMKQFLKSKGISTGIMTKELYVEFSQNRTKELREKGDTRTDEEKKKDEEARSRDYFKSMDKNNDNALTKDELEAARQNRLPGSRLLDDFSRYDKNNNGKIELDEYLSYAQERSSRDQGRDERWRFEEEGKKEEEVKRPVVYRIGHLPKDLPSWFEPVDTDKDAQVGLYEWKGQGKVIDEFLQMDTNRDGFVTVEELLRFEKVKKTKEAAKLNGALASGMPVPQPGAADTGEGDKSGEKGRFRGMTWGGNRGGGNGKMGGMRGLWGGGGDGKSGGMRGKMGGMRGPWGGGGDGKSGGMRGPWGGGGDSKSGGMRGRMGGKR